MTAEQPELLFFDTFAHDASEQLNLDLVQFPKSVFVREIRIIPLGARVEGDFAGGVRLGATNPTKFHIDFFVNDLSKPGASTFEALGSLDYCQNGQIHMECGTGLDHPNIPTDGLVLRGCYTTITLAVYGNLTQVIPETPVGANPPPAVQKPAVAREPVPVASTSGQQVDWNPENANPIPTYTGNVASSNPDSYGPNNYPQEPYENQMYRNEFYENAPPKDPRIYHHVEDEWEKDRRELSCDRDAERLRLSPRSLDDRDRTRRESRSRRRSLGRSRESSRHRSREIDRLDRLPSRSRSREREYIVKGEYRPLSRSRSRSIDRERIRALSGDRDWDRGSYKKDDYRRREHSYDRSRGGSYDKRSGSYDRRSPYDKRAPSYERKPSYDKRASSYDKMSPYEKRGSSYERRPPSYEKQSPYDKKRLSPYSSRLRSYSRSPSRDDPRKRPRTPTNDRRPISPRDPGIASPMRDENDFERGAKQIPRVDYYQSYRHKSSIRSPSEERGNPPPFVETQHNLVTVQIVDNPPPPKEIESPPRPAEEEKSLDTEQFEPILSDEDICDDMDGPSYMEVDYDVNEYCGVEDIIKYFNPYKADWNKYEFVNKIQFLAHTKKEDIKDVLNSTFDELCDVNIDLFKISEIAKAAKKREQKFFTGTFTEIDSSSKEEWVHHCEQLYGLITNLTKTSDILLRIFRDKNNPNGEQEFCDIYNMLLTFCRIGLNFEFALAQPQPTYKIRHMKCGIRIAEALVAHKHNSEVIKVLLSVGIDLSKLLLEMYAKEYMALSIRLMILKALNACLSSKEAIDHFMQVTVFPKFDKNASDVDNKNMNGYQALISMMQSNPLSRIKFSISALIKKLNMYELLGKLNEVVLNFNNNVSGSDGNENGELSEKDIDFIVISFEEILYMYRSQCFHISQPKRFLPASAQFDINKDCSNETLLEFFNIHHTLKVCLYLLTCPTTCNNLVVVSPVYELIHELIFSHNGLFFLYDNMLLSELLFKILSQPLGQHATEEFIYPLDLSTYTDLQVLGLELAYRLKAVYYLQSISDLQVGKVEENELIDRLQSLYCLSFGNIGRIAVPDVVVVGDNADCLMEVFESDLKSRNKNESPLKQKSPAKGYAIELIVSAVRYSSNVMFLKKYGPRLINVSKEHDRFEPSVSSILQEIISYLKPIEKTNFLTGDDIAECMEILKANIEHSADLPGELTTSLRILRHYCMSDYDTNMSIVCENPTEEYIELKYKYNILQLFSLDGVAHLVGILDRLATHFEQPSMHSSFFASIKGLQLCQIILPCVRLLDEMLARVVRCRGSRFRDLTAAPILLKTYGIVKTYPAGSVGFRTATKAAEATVKVLLAYAQPIADDGHDGDSIRKGAWTSLCSEVISYTMTAPYTFVPGLLVFSELLPLPLPMQTKTAPTDRELSDAINERKMWSAHLHALSNDLSDMIQIICMSTYRPVVHMLRRVCVQVADLAPNTANTVAKAAVDAVIKDLKEGEPASANTARVLGFLACLMANAPVKCAVIYIMNSGGPKATELQMAMCKMLSQANASTDHTSAQEYAAHILAALCDAEISLTPINAPPDALFANSLPNRESLAVLLESSADCLASSTKTCAAASAILRAYFVLTEHEFGFQQFKKFATKKRDCLGKFFKWTLEGPGDDKVDCFNLYVDLMRILKVDEGDGPIGRKSLLAAGELADMVGYDPGDADHPVMSLEKILKERNCETDALSVLSGLPGAASPSVEPGTPPAQDQAVTEPPVCTPEALVSQFAARTVYSIGEASDERLTAGYWLHVPTTTPEDDVSHTDLVLCDILEIANTHLCGGGGGELGGAVRRLAGCVEPPAPHRDDKRAPVCVVGVGGAGAGADAFRSRPPNTSRPPSLHVDDFTAMHQPYTHNYSRGARRGDRGRFPAPHHYRHVRARGAWEGAQFSPFPYNMGGMWGGARMQRAPRHRTFMR